MKLLHLFKKALPKNSWDDEDVDDDEIKESWEDEEEPAPVILFPDSKCFPLLCFFRRQSSLKLNLAF